MKIAVIGAGIVGIATAYELAADGHAVTVIERHAGAAEEASFGHAGLLSASRVLAWTAPGGLLPSRRRGVRLTRPWSRRDLAWLLNGAKHPAGADAALLQLARFSLERLAWLSESLQLEYESCAGCLVLLRDPAERKRIDPGLNQLREAGVTWRELDAAAARQLEPGLSTDSALSGAIELPDDGAGNCRQFAHLLRAEAQAAGVVFEFNRDVLTVSGGARPQLEMAGEPKSAHFDAIVLCAGLGSEELLQSFGLRKRLVAVHGYSINAPVREPLHAPRAALVDQRHGVSITRLGQRVRVSGGAELGGSPNVKPAASVQQLYRVLHDWFPGAARLSGPAGAVIEWKGARPTSPDGLPLLGKGAEPGLWINTAHADHGWTLACGSARVLADQIAGHDSTVDISALAPR